MLSLNRLGALAAGGLISGLLLTGSAGAQTVTLQLGSPFMWGGGGEFIATPEFFAVNPVSLTNDGNFQTFCFQSTVDISLGVPLQAYFVAGMPPVPPGGPALNEQVAYLYNLFITGTLPQYDYDDNTDGGIRELDAGALQYAIWELTGQSTAGQTFNPLPARTEFYKNLAIANAQPGNFYDVTTLAVYTGTIEEPTFQQALLVKIPAPGAAALFGAGGLLVLQRRRRN